MGKNVTLSIIVPLYNEEQSVTLFYSSLKEVLDKLKYPYEIIFVDDGSTDQTFEIIKRIYEENNSIKIIKFRRNFGKSAALSAGFALADKELVVTMDGDSQDSPEEIANLISKIDEGFDLISGRRVVRKDSFAKIISSKIFNLVTAILTGINMHDFNCGLKIFKREVTQNINLYGELHRFIPVLAFWQGYKVGELRIKHYPRKHGKSKFGMERFSSGFFDLVTTLFITRYNRKPLHLFGLIGAVLFISGFSICGGLAIWKYTAGLVLSQSRPLLLLILGIFFIVVGLQFFSIGLVCEMVINISFHKGAIYSIEKKLE